jgi:predicted membrane-bound spermidine synthase
MLNAKSNQAKFPTRFEAIPLLLALYLISGFTALLYQVAWQRMLGLFSGSDVRSVTIIVASYLLGLGLGMLAGSVSDRLRIKNVSWSTAAATWVLLLFP